MRFKLINRKSAEEVGVGRTINMSSNGVLFTTDQYLLPGRRLEVSISWPAQLNSKVGLKLVARGRVVRCDEGRGGDRDSSVRIPYAVYAGATTSELAPSAFSSRPCIETRCGPGRIRARETHRNYLMNYCA